MKIRKFTAASIPEALNLVRSEMGDDALILGTSRSRGRKGRAGEVEVVAARDRMGGRAETRATSHTKEIKDMRKLDRDIVTELKQIETRLKDFLESFDAPAARRSEKVLPLNKDLVNAGFDPAMLSFRIGQDHHAS